MAVVSELKGVKIVLDLEKGTQTIPNCNPSATDENLSNLALAVASLESTQLENVVKVVETVLIQE